MTPPAAEPDRLTVGRIGKPQGIRGEVTVEVRTDVPEVRFADGAVLLTDDRPLTVASSRWQNGRLVVAFEGVPDRSAAELLRDTLLQVDAADVPPSDDPDEFHDSQLIGMAADLVGGGTLGTVTDVLHLPHGDVLVVQRADASAADATARPGASQDPAARPGAAEDPPARPGAAEDRVARPGAAEVLVPFVRQIVPEVDVPARRLLVDPPEGLLDLP